MKVTYNQILIWHNSLNEAMNGYGNFVLQQKMFGGSTTELENTAKILRFYVVKYKQYYESNNIIDCEDITYETIKIIEIAMKGAKNEISEWEIPLRLGVNINELSFQIQVVEKYKNALNI